MIKISNLFRKINEKTIIFFLQQIKPVFVHVVKCDLCRHGDETTPLSTLTGGTLVVMVIIFGRFCSPGTKKKKKKKTNLGKN